VSSIAGLSIVTSDRAIDDVRVGKRHGAVSRVALLSMLIFDRQFLTERKRFSSVVRYAQCPMPCAGLFGLFGQCPARANALRGPMPCAGLFGLFGLRGPVWPVWPARACLANAQCPMPCAGQCPARACLACLANAQCPMPYALFALCPMPCLANAQCPVCPMPYALCPMPYEHLMLLIKAISLIFLLLKIPHVKRITLFFFLNKGEGKLKQMSVFTSR
jgi:hypothetical protein